MAQLKARIFANKLDQKNLVKKVRSLQDYPEEIQRILRHEAANVVGRMKQDAPVDTGRLRREIEAVVRKDNEVVVSSKAIDPQTGIDYAPIREYGLDGNRSQPYFRHNRDLFFTRLRQRFTRLLKQITDKK